MRKMALLLVGVLAIGLFSGCTQKRVLIVTQYPEGSPRVTEMLKAIKAEFTKEEVPLTYSEFHMDTVNHPGEVSRDEMGRAAVTRAHSLAPHMVFVAGDDAARYCAQRMAGMFKEFVFLDVKGDPSNYHLTGSIHTTGVQEEVPVKEAFAEMKRLVPNARGAYVLADSSLAGDAVTAKIMATNDLAIRVVEIKRVRTQAEWMDAVREAQTKADVLCIASYASVLPVEGSVTAVPGAELLRITSQANRLPDFSFYPEAVQGQFGVLMAMAVPISRQGTIAAQMATKAMYHDWKTGELKIVRCADYRTYTSPERAAQLGVKLSTVPATPAKPAPTPTPAK